MKTYTVKIKAELFKLITVEAKDENEACELAHELFDLHCDEFPEKYSQDTVEVKETELDEA